MLEQNSNFENKPITQKILKIDHRNYISYLEEESLINLKFSLYSTLASIEEEIIGQEIEKIFQDFIPDPNSDILKTILTKCQIIYTTRYKSDCQKYFEDLRNGIESIINKNYNMEFYFFNSSIEELAKVLIYSYLELSDFIFDKNIKKTKYKISTYKDFIRAIDNLLDKNVDVIKRYRDKNIQAKLSVSSDSTRSSFSSGNQVNIGLNNLRMVNSSSYSDRDLLHAKTIPNPASSPMYNYTHNIQQLHEFELPIEFVILLNKFQTVKRLKLFVPNKINELSLFILVLSNIEWLFPNLFEIELDLSMGNLHGEFYEAYYNTYKKEKLYTTRKYSRDSSASRKVSTNYVSYLDHIKNNKHHLDLLIIYAYYISKLDKIKFLSLNFPESLQLEINEALKLSDVNTPNLHLLSFFNNLSNLYQLNLDFNCLDYITFEKIISIILKNNQMKSLKLNIFSGEEYGNYSSNGLFKLASMFNLNIKTGKTVYNKSEADYLLYDPFSAESDILDKLVTKFEENLEKLFYVIQLKQNLSELQIKADLPRVISNSDNFVLIFHKFLFDIFTMLNSNEEVCSIQTLKVMIPHLPFDNRKFPSISSYFSSFNLKENEKFTKLTNLSIHLRFNKVYNLSNIISHKLKFLQIGDLDVDTFADLTKLFAKEEFKIYSQLTCLNITLSNIITDYKSIKNELDSFLSADKPQNLKEISFNCALVLSEEEIKRIYKFINYDTVEKYSFTFSKKCNEIFLNVNQNNFSNLEDRTINKINTIDISDTKNTNYSEPIKLFYKVENKKLNSKIVKLLYKLYKKKSNGQTESKSTTDYMKSFLFNIKLFKSVREYLLNYEKKEIQIVFK